MHIYSIIQSHTTSSFPKENDIDLTDNNNVQDRRPCTANHTVSVTRNTVQFYRKYCNDTSNLIIRGHCYHNQHRVVKS